MLSSFDYECLNFPQIVFDIHQVRRNRELVAANIRADNSCPLSESPTSLLQQFANASAAPGGFNHGSLNTCDMGALMSSLLGNSNNTADNTIPVGGDNLVNENRNNDVFVGAEKENSISSSQEYLMRFSNSTQHGGLSFGADEPENNTNGLYREESCSDIDEIGQGDMYMVRKSSRSPSDSSDVVAVNGSYSGYSEDNPSPPQSTTKTPRVVMKGYIAALKDGFGFIETMAQDGEIFFHSR